MFTAFTTHVCGHEYRQQPENLAEAYNHKVMVLVSVQNDEERMEWIAENECGGVKKPLLAGRGRKALSGGEADSH